VYWTKQKTQKAKRWADGFLTAKGGKLTLLDDDGGNLDSEFRGGSKPVCSPSPLHHRTERLLAGKAQHRAPDPLLHWQIEEGEILDFPKYLAEIVELLSGDAPEPAKPPAPPTQPIALLGVKRSLGAIGVPPLGRSAGLARPSGTKPAYHPAHLTPNNNLRTAAPEHSCFSERDPGGIWGVTRACSLPRRFRLASTKSSAPPASAPQVSLPQTRVHKLMDRARWQSESFEMRKSCHLGGHTCGRGGARGRHKFYLVHRFVLP